MLSAPSREDAEVASGPWFLWRRWILPVSVALLAVPFVVAVMAQRTPQWFPVLDLAMTELRVRDVFTRDIPLIGLPGRIGDFPDQGSHPGPLSFYALAPFYRVFGSTSWALQAATGVLNLIAGSLALWIGHRRAGATGVAAVFLLLAVLLRGYGMETLVEPWNPLMPLLWWVVLLLAVWSVLSADVKLLPIAVLAASFCAQTHVPYLGLALGMGALGVVGVVLVFRRTPPGSPRRTIIRWVVAAAGLGLVLWTPPVVDQLTADRGNFSMLAEHFTTDPPEAKIGYVEGVEWLLVNLNPWYLVARGEGIVGGPFVTAAFDPTRSPLPGAVLLAVWGVAVGVAVHRRLRPLLRLHAVIGAGLALGVLSLANVFGKQWYYLTLWTWALVALMVGTIAWTILLLVRERLPVGQASALGSRTGLVMLVLATVIAGVVTVQSVGEEQPDPMLSAVLGDVIGPTTEALDRGVGAADGSDGRYLVEWSDSYFIGSHGYGLVLELERRGYDAGVTDVYRVPTTRQRVLDPDEVTAEIHLATGRWVDVVAQRPGAVEVVRTDPRSPAEVAEFDRLRAEIIDELHDIGRDDLVELVDSNLFALPIEPGIPPDLERKAFRLLLLGQPTAVFILPPVS